MCQLRRRCEQTERAHAIHVKLLRRRADPVMKPDCCPAWDLNGTIRGASTEGTAGSGRCDFSRRTLWDRVSETEIDPRRCGRGRLRHLMNPEALGFPGHNEPLPRP